MRTNTSIERVDQLILRSDAIYGAIDPEFDGEPRAKRMLRVGINTLALSLRRGESVERAGARLLTLPNVFARTKAPLDELSDMYADIRRATHDRDGNLETDARHAIHLMKLAVPYAREFYPELDQGRIAAYALIHDIIEAYVGDVPSLVMTAEQEQQKQLDEAQALIRLHEEYGEEWPEFIALIESYEALDTPEACFVKTFDKLDPGFTHFYSHGAQLKSHYGLSEDSFYVAIDKATQRMQRYSGEYGQIMEDRDELTRRVAHVAFKNAA
ncbi:hypothetical protein BGO17_00595 [Candidatus Saccharibacteria bacterium 49-20]|nr:MAG: hypothetical protein BGO17_00595 [Candidatus Saccharibacteria bacterium 49-20]